MIQTNSWRSRAIGSFLAVERGLPPIKPPEPAPAGLAVDKEEKDY